MAKEDVKFTFDTSGFKKAFEGIAAGFNNMVTQTKKGLGSVNNKLTEFFEKRKKAREDSKKANREISQGVLSALGKFALIAGAVVGAFKIAQTAIRNFIPEVGQTFSIVGKVVGRNLLMPLRRELVPILQKVLNWAQKNRANFVKWGAVLVNVFKFIVVTAKSIFRVFEPIIRRIKEFVQSIFGDTAASITETINLMIFKLTALVIGMETLLKPLFEGIGNAVEGLLVGIKAFVGEFVDAFTSMFNPLEKGDGLIKSLGESFSKLGDALKRAAPLFRILGQVIGTSVGIAVKAFIVQVKLLIDSLTLLFDLLTKPKEFKKTLSEFFKGAGKDLKKFTDDVIRGVTTSGGKIVDIAKGGKKPKKVKDLIITKSGQTFETSPDDNIIATKNNIGDIGSPSGAGKKIDISLNIGDINLNVTEGNARQAGSNFASGMMEKIKTGLLDQVVLQGGF